MTNAKVFSLVASVMLIALYLVPSSIGAYTLLSWTAYDVTTWHWVFRLAMGVCVVPVVWYAAYLGWGKDA